VSFPFFLSGFFFNSQGDIHFRLARRNVDLRVLDMDRLKQPELIQICQRVLQKREIEDCAFLHQELTSENFIWRSRISDKANPVDGVLRTFIDRNGQRQESPALINRNST
jgi:hypothetical protein